MKILSNYLSNRILKHFSSNIEVRVSQQGLNSTDNYEIFFHQLDSQTYKQLVKYIRKYVDLVSGEGYLTKNKFLFLIQDTINEDFAVMKEFLGKNNNINFEEFDFVDSLYQIVNFQHNIKHYPLRFFYRKQFALYKGKLLGVLGKSLFGIFQKSKYRQSDEFYQYPFADAFNTSEEQECFEYEKVSVERDMPSPSAIAGTVFSEAGFSGDLDESFTEFKKFSHKRSRDYKSFFASFLSFAKYAFGAAFVLVIMFVFFQMLNTGQENYYLVEPGDLVEQPNEHPSAEDPKTIDFNMCNFKNNYMLREVGGYLVWFDKQYFVIGKITYEIEDDCDDIGSKIASSIHYSLSPVPEFVKDNPHHTKLTNLTLDNDNILFTLNIRNQDYLYENGNLLYFFQGGFQNSFPDETILAVSNSRYLFAKKVLISSLEKFSADVGMYEKGISPIDKRFDWKYMLSLGLIVLLFMFSIAVVFLRDNFIKRLFHKLGQMIANGYRFVFSDFHLYYSFGKIIMLFAGLGLSILFITSLMRFSLFSMITVLILSYLWTFFYYYIVNINNMIIIQIESLKKFYNILPGYYEMKNLIQDKQNSHKIAASHYTKKDLQDLKDNINL
ncbi:MAG: hypothetical protein V3575_01955 [Candidatus Absconditabacteria bacterium]